jgi:hypothetical protein
MDTTDLGRGTSVASPATILFAFGGDLLLPVTKLRLESMAATATTTSPRPTSVATTSTFLVTRHDRHDDDYQSLRAAQR